MPSANSSRTVRIVEVGPRDGLQNVKEIIPTATKVELIRKLCATGLQNIEVTSMVSPRAVPQLADGKAVLEDTQVQQLLQIHPQTRAPVLIPNIKGLHIAMQYGVKEVAVFVSASEGFSQANIKCSVQRGLDSSRKVAERALSHGISVRGYVSCIFACPFDGATPHQAVLHCVKELLDMGCYEISLGDTIGVGAPTQVCSLVSFLTEAGIPVGKLAGHFHDTYGQAMANVWAAYHCGVRVFDSSVAGLGGCPYAPGAKGNLATEDLVYSLHTAGIDTGVNLSQLVDVGAWISQQLSAPNSSRAGNALRAAKSTAKSRDMPSVEGLQWTQKPADKDIQVFRSGTNLKLVLNRPQNGNALTVAMMEQLTKIFEAAKSDETITRIAITAKGKYFCTGMDLARGSSPVAKGGATTDAQFNRLTRLFEAIDHAPQVTLALVQGPAFGGGVGLAFACDIRLMTAAASIRLTEVRLGLAPATISKYVIRELGVPFAREAMLSARSVTAKELVQLGRIAMVVEPGVNPQDALDAYLIGLKHCAPRSSSLTKELVRLAWEDGGGGGKQADGIRRVFDDMMLPDSEAAYGLERFQAGIKDIDWDRYALGKALAKSRL
ncbi:hypothetical protein H634G_07485 [Metarhizium anisopliae BRIP 53293]|uniref:hydroxymethylglutaryl-CoA lyase n=1 Tax=Metarhizium anisopliae BRIP 53293 TaxID=1291518 RepID=A0A0D9NTV1_METAN|nr:hypothetical protein H634G_07485 [Metarhizium anisopliae BRIP 53293]KJK96078.1 hypothetical protein H633G_00018 [Metarhizium anisopliae BRIP 53284]